LDVYPLCAFAATYSVRDKKPGTDRAASAGLPADSERETRVRRQRDALWEHRNAGDSEFPTAREFRRSRLRADVRHYEVRTVSRVRVAVTVAGLAIDVVKMSVTELLGGAGSWEVVGSPPQPSR
jgi:hypothetical protein